MIKTTIDLFDKLMADTIGTTVENWLSKTDDLDEDQLNSITTRLASINDEDVEEGIRMFNDI